MFAPANTPRPIVERLNREIVRYLNEREIKEAFLNNGVEVVGSTPEQLADKIKDEMTRLRKVIEAAKIIES